MTKSNVRGNVKFEWFTVEPVEGGRYALIGWGEYTRYSVLAGQTAGPCRTFPEFDTVEEAKAFVEENFEGLDVRLQPQGDAAGVRWLMGSGAPDTYLGDDYDY